MLSNRKSTPITAKSTFSPSHAVGMLKVPPSCRLSRSLWDLSQGFSDNFARIPKAASGRLQAMRRCLRHLIRWHVLRQVILGSAGNAVVIGPAIDHRRLLAPVAMPGRHLRRLPFERRRVPRVSFRLPAVPDAPDQVEEEQ